MNNVTLKDAYKRFTLDQDKTLPPEETVRRFKEKLKKIDLNILEDTIRIDNGRLDIPVYFSCSGNFMGVLTTTAEINRDIQSAIIDSDRIFENIEIDLF